MRNKRIQIGFAALLAFIILPSDFRLHVVR